MENEHGPAGSLPTRQYFRLVTHLITAAARESGGPAIRCASAQHTSQPSRSHCQARTSMM